MKILEKFKSLKNYFTTQKIARKGIILSIMLLTWFILLGGALLSPENKDYSEAQLNPEQIFSNGTGEINLVSQTYSKKNGILLLQFETTDETTSIKKGIDSSNLKWQLYGKDKSKKQTMQIIPIIDNKISVVVKNVPEDFEVLAVQVTNETINPHDIDINVNETEGTTTSSSETTSGNEDNVVTFFITPSNKNLENKKIENISREEFAYEEIEKEKNNQMTQKEKLEKSIEQLNSSIVSDQATLAELQKKSQYLTGQDQETNDSDIKTIESDITSKETQIETAKGSIETIDARIEMLDKKKEDIQNGDFKFSDSIKTVEMN